MANVYSRAKRSVAGKYRKMTCQLDGKNKVHFSTGVEIYTHNGIVGIDEALGVTHGYDGSINLWPDEDYVDGRAFSSPVECIELADMMIARWMAYRKRAEDALK